MTQMAIRCSCMHASSGSKGSLGIGEIVTYRSSCSAVRIKVLNARAVVRMFAEQRETRAEIERR
jgi:hypothetical protein